jgi:predicted PilT family ATPase
MVSNKDAGTVIGRQGATINTMQQKSGSRIRVSNAHDYFPGTQERVVLITGTEVSQVEAGTRCVLEEVFCNAESLQNREGNADAPVLLKLIIPNAAAGLVIGKGGENIRKMVEDSGAKIQLTGKELQVPGLEERVLNVTGSVPQLMKASELVVHKICDDTEVRFQNISTNYSRMQFGAPPPVPWGGGMGGHHGHGPPMMRGPPPAAPLHNAYGAYGAPPPAPPAAAAFGGYSQPDPYGGYQSQAPPPPAYSAYPQAPASYDNYPPSYASAPAPSYGAPPAQSAAPPAASYDYSSYGGYGQQQQSAPISTVPQVTQGAGGQVVYSLQVPDHVVPAILGRGGTVIKEFMDQSGANIKISQKGEYAPGTSNRVITITGSQHQASFAHQLVSLVAA